MSDPVASDLVAILVCPECKSIVVQEGDYLQCTNPKCRLKYPIRDGIPIMIREEAESPSKQ